MSAKSALLAAAVLASAVGCVPSERELTAEDGAGWHGFLSARAAAEPIPSRFGLGRPATVEEIARLDIDVMPDGTGLPPGAGQAGDGAPIYAAKCAWCHGSAGEGVRGVGDRLVGRRPGDAFDFAASRQNEREKTIGSYWPYATTLFDYIRRAMPFDRPGSLSNDEVYALTAYLLHLNHIIAADAVMDAATLPRVVMPARNRFQPDDREQSRRVR